MNDFEDEQVRDIHSGNLLFLQAGPMALAEMRVKQAQDDLEMTQEMAQDAQKHTQEMIAELERLEVYAEEMAGTPQAREVLVSIANITNQHHFSGRESCAECQGGSTSGTYSRE